MQPLTVTRSHQIDPFLQQINELLTKGGAADPIQYADFVEKVMP